MVKDTWRQKKTQIIRNLEEMKGEAYKRKQFWLIKHSLDNITQEHMVLVVIIFSNYTFAALNIWSSGKRILLPINVTKISL